jgi:hypothetical protein
MSHVILEQGISVGSTKIEDMLTWNASVPPGFMAKPSAHSMCVQESSLHTYHTENGCRITNVIV